MKTKHTPGPWEIKPLRMNYKHRFYLDLMIYAGDQFIATRRVMEPFEQEEAEANARLIAAAPDLLAALENAKEHLGLLFYWDAGERFCGHCKRSARADHQDDCPINIIDKAIAKAKVGA